MKMKHFILSTIFMLLATSSWAGWEITYRVSGDQGSISYDVMLINDNVVKYGGVDGGFILNTQTNAFTFLIDQNKSYWNGSISDFRKEMSQALKTVMDSLLQAIPEAQREMYSQMLGSMSQIYDSPERDQIAALNIEVDNTGRTENIAGYDAQEYEVRVDDKLLESIWIARGLDVDDDLDSRRIAEMLNEITPNVEGEIFYEFSEDYLALWEKGFRMKSTDHDGEIIEVIKVVEREIASDELDIPDGYKQITIQELMQQQMGGDADDNDTDGGW
jgi:hypothetical protein